MEPTHQPFRKENDLNQTSRELCSISIFQGVTASSAPENGAVGSSPASFPPKKGDGVKPKFRSRSRSEERQVPLTFCVESGQKTGVFLGGGKGGK